MTIEQIKDLIAAKITGQGSAVDAGSALPEILNGVLDLIGEAVKPVLTVTVEEDSGTDQPATALKGITADELEKLALGYYDRIHLVSESSVNAEMVFAGFDALSVATYKAGASDYLILDSSAEDVAVSWEMTV